MDSSGISLQFHAFMVISASAMLHQVNASIVITKDKPREPKMGKLRKCNANGTVKITKGCAKEIDEHVKPIVERTQKSSRFGVSMTMRAVRAPPGPIPLRISLISGANKRIDAQCPIAARS